MRPALRTVRLAFDWVRCACVFVLRWVRVRAALRAAVVRLACEAWALRLRVRAAFWAVAVRWAFVWPEPLELLWVAI